MTTHSICIDPGHGGRDGGATAIDQTLEKEFTLALGLAVRDTLTQGYECTVVMTRETDRYVDLGERAMIANRAKADLLISLHHDSSSNPVARGGSMYIHTNKRNPQDSTQLAWLPAVEPSGLINHEAPNSHKMAVLMVPILKAKLARYGIPWRSLGDRAGLMCADFWVLDQCWGPCVLFESYFGSNHDDNQAAKRPTFVSDVAAAVTKALVVALGLPPKAEQTPHAEAAAALVNTQALDRLGRLGLIDGTPDPKAHVTWEELAIVLNRVIERLS